MPDLLSSLLTSVSRSFILRDRLLRRVPSRLPPSTPDIRIQRLQLNSHPNRLDAVLVQPASHPPSHGVLLCHGIGETVEHWSHVQLLLARHEVASLVFDYSGYGRSTGSITPKQCERDAIAAFHALQQTFPGLPVSLLGFSLGSGIATAVHHELPASKLILCAAFTSLREAAARMGLPPAFHRVLPDIWRTEDTLPHASLPVLIVHGERDRLFPPRMARALAAACRPPCELIVLPGLTHNAPMYNPQLTFWGKILSRL